MTTVYCPALNCKHLNKKTITCTKITITLEWSKDDNSNYFDCNNYEATK